MDIRFAPYTGGFTVAGVVPQWGTKRCLAMIDDLLLEVSDADVED